MTSHSSALPPNLIQGTPTRPYLIRALHEWCCDNQFTPYIAVQVGKNVQVPTEYVKDGEIVLNIGFDATSDLHLGNEAIAFKARFSGRVREIMIPVEYVVAIYARENGQGMSFPAPKVETEEAQTTNRSLSAVDLGELSSHPEADDSTSASPPPDKPPRGRPQLKRIK